MHLEMQTMDSQVIVHRLPTTIEDFRSISMPNITRIPSSMGIVPFSQLPRAPLPKDSSSQEQSHSAE